VAVEVTVMGEAAALDPVTTEVVGSGLLDAAEGVGAALVRGAFSPNIKERRDCSAAVFDAGGELVAQAEHIPLHLGSLMGVVREVLRRFPAPADGASEGGLRPGDAFIANDPYAAGGTHLPDITLVSPFFHGGRLVGFVANIAHHSDVGGAVPGGIAGDARSIYEEGLRLPPLRVMEGGRLRDDVVELISLNCRLPEQRRLDLQAQVAANAVGLARLESLCRRYGACTVARTMAALLDYSEGRLRRVVRDIPDGVYSFEDFLDDDGLGRGPLPVRVSVRVEGEDLTFDFTGSAPQVGSAVNVPRAALEATVFYAVKAALDPDLPANGGFHRVITIRTEPGSILDPRPPAACGARTDTCQRVAGTVLGALAKARPERVPAGSNDASTAVVFSGRDARGREFVYVEAVGGGGGARPGKDGLSGVQVHVTNTSNLPVEALEAEFPLRVEAYRFAPGSGGPGRWKGGLGLVRDIRVLADGVVFSCHGDRQKIPPYGLRGGGPGRPGRFVLNPGRPDERVLPSKTSGVVLCRGDLLRIVTPGGGGYGRPT